MQLKDFLKTTLEEIKVDAKQSFEENFRRKAFFNEKWPDSNRPTTRGSLMLRSGKLRGSIRAEIVGNGVRFSSSVPYASIHNNGGEIEVTSKMKKFFWAMYYKTSGAITKKKNGENAKGKRNVQLTTEATYWKNLALQKTGAKMRIKKRQFIGSHPMLQKHIEEIINHNLNKLEIKPFTK